MSLFQSFGQGDFWGKGFAFASPVTDLLDRGDYTLTEIFDEDDLLQEIKSMNTRLIDYLSQEVTLEELVKFLVEPAEEGADDKRIHKYPYMACEVICCEVDHIIDNLVAMKEGQMIHRIFSLLDKEGDLDDRLSGYFEKVVFVLLKRKCLQLMHFINEGGLDLFRKFVRHLNNYSIMQLVERLFLHQPGWEGAYNTGPVGLDLGSGDDDASGSGSGTDLALLRCNWSTMPEVVDILVDQLVEQGEEGGKITTTAEGGVKDDAAAATHTHVAELLLTVIENASPDSVFIKNLTDKISRLADLAIPALDLSKGPQELQEEALSIVKEERSSMLSALTIVEALLSRPQAIKMHWDMGQQAQSAEGLMEGGGGIGNNNNNEGTGGIEGLMEGLANTGTLGDEVTDKLISSLPLLRVYLTTHELDERTVNTQIREPAPTLGLTRLKLVRHVEALVKLCNARVDRPLEQEGVLKVCLDMFFKYEWTSVLHQSITRIVTWIMDAGPSRLDLQVYLVKECDVLQRILAANDYNDRQQQPNTGKPRCRRGYMGHLFIMAQAIMEAARPPLPDDPMLPEVEEGKRTFTQVMEMELEPDLVMRWTEFIQGRLAQVTATQCHPLGGYPIPSRADENKLSTKFEEPSPDFDQMSEMLAQRLSGVDVGKPGEGVDETGEASVAWRETVSMQLTNEEMNLALGAAGMAAFRVGHADGFDTEEVVFALEGPEEKGGEKGGGVEDHLRLNSPLGGGGGGWDGTKAAFEGGGGSNSSSSGGGGGPFGTFGRLDDPGSSSPNGSGGGGGGWADFSNFEAAFSSAGDTTAAATASSNPFSSTSPSSSSQGFSAASAFSPTTDGSGDTISTGNTTATTTTSEGGGDREEEDDGGFDFGPTSPGECVPSSARVGQGDGGAVAATAALVNAITTAEGDADAFLSTNHSEGGRIGSPSGCGSAAAGGGENGSKRDTITDYFQQPPSSSSSSEAVTPMEADNHEGEGEGGITSSSAGRTEEVEGEDDGKGMMVDQEEEGAAVPAAKATTSTTSTSSSSSQDEATG